MQYFYLWWIHSYSLFVMGILFLPTLFTHVERRTGNVNLYSALHKHAASAATPSIHNSCRAFGSGSVRTCFNQLYLLRWNSNIHLTACEANAIYKCTTAEARYNVSGDNFYMFMNKCINLHKKS